MKMCFRRPLLVACVGLTLAGCGNKQTKEALGKAAALENQKQYQDANDVLVEALRARELEIRGNTTGSSDPKVVDAETKNVQSDSEILKMERAQIPLYIYVQRADLASAVYADILAGNPGDKVVYDALVDKDPIIRTGATRILGLAGSPDSIDALATATRDTDQDVRRAAVAALGQIKDPRVVPPLIDALKDSYWFVRSDAADALGRERDARAVNPLLDTVPDSDSNVETSSENALVALCQGASVSGDLFAQRLDDANPKIVLISAVCLAVLKDPRSIPVLLKMVDSSDASTRLHAVKALGESGDPSAIPALRKSLGDSDINVRGWSIIGLGKLKDQGSLAALNAIAANAQENPNIRNAASAALNNINAPPSTTTATDPAQPGSGSR